MKSLKLSNVKFRSRCQAAVSLLKHTKLPNTVIAHRCKLTDAAVSIMNKKYHIRPVRHYNAFVN